MGSSFSSCTGGYIDAETVKFYDQGVLCRSPGGADVNGQCVETAPERSAETDLLFHLIGMAYTQVLVSPVRPAR